MQKFLLVINTFLVLLWIIKFVDFLANVMKEMQRNLNDDILSKIKEADKVLGKNGEKYHKIDTEVDKT